MHVDLYDISSDTNLLSIIDMSRYILNYICSLKKPIIVCMMFTKVGMNGEGDREANSFVIIGHGPL